MTVYQKELQYRKNYEERRMENSCWQFKSECEKKPLKFILFYLQLQRQDDLRLRA